MKWRVLVLLIAGVAMIYFVSLLQDIPYPHPLIIQSFEPKQIRRNEPRQVILSETDDYIYRTHIHYEAAIDSSRGFLHGVDSIKLNVYGLVIQARKKKSEFLKEAPEEDWETCFSHLLRGPISKVSRTPEDSGLVQFATLYHQLEDNAIKHYVRVYYLNTDSFEYKDLLLPGNTMINAFSLEQDVIIYSRDPDSYRFRIAVLPHNLTMPPHSDKSAIIPLIDGQPGDTVKQFHQPKNTKSHASLLSGLYSPNIDTLRVFTLDIHETKYYFHTNVSIFDGHRDNTTRRGEWILRDHLNTRDSTISEESLEYMSYVDGAHFHQERTFIKMPIPCLSRSKDSKTIVVSLIRNDFQTLDYTDNLSALKSNRNDRQYLYKTSDGDILDEFYHTMPIPDSVESSDSAYDDIRGVQLNANGTLLAVWTETNSIYIYKRGSGDQVQQQRWSFEKTPESPHYLEKPLEWILRMVITPKEGNIGSTAPVGSVLFWEEDNHHYISVGMKNHVVNTYSIDEAKEQAEVNFKSFMRDKWDLWMVMTMIVTIFVVNEYKSYPA